MKTRLAFGVAAFTLGLSVACTTGDKGATPSDTATGQSTSIAPANASAPAVSPAVDSVVPAAPKSSAGAATTATPRTTTRPKASTTPEEPLRDSAFKPRATVDEKGNVQPIKRDSLK